MAQAHHVNRSDLVRIAAEVMAERGLEPEFPAAVRAQLATITGPGRDDGPAHPRSHRAALVFDRQRRLARSRPAHGLRASWPPAR